MKGVRSASATVLLLAGLSGEAAAGQDPQQEYARDALAAVAAGDEELLEALARELPFRARLLVHELLWEAWRAGRGDERALGAARQLASAFRAAGAGDDLSLAVQAATELDEESRGAQRAFDRAFFAASEAAQRSGWSTTETHAREAVDHALAAGLPYLELRARRLLAEALLRRGASADFRAEMLPVLELERALELSLEALADLELLARAEAEGSLLRQAAAHLEEAERLARLTGDPLRAALLLSERGAVLANLGSHAAARELLDRALAALQESGSPEQRAHVLALLGALASGCGRYGEALERLSDAARAWAEAGDPAGDARARVQLAGVYSELGLTSDAEDALARALVLIGEHELGAERAPAFLARGLLQLDAGRPDEALATLDELLRTSETAAPLRAEAERHRGTAWLALDRPHEAEASFRRSLELWSADPLARAWCRTALGDALSLQGRSEAAEREYGLVLQETTGLSSLEGTWRARLGLGRVAEARGDPERALASYARALEEVEAIRGWLVAPALRARWLGNALELYRRAAWCSARTGALGEAFRTAEAAKARTLLELTAIRPGGTSAVEVDSGRVSDALRRLAEAESSLRLFERRSAELPRATAAAGSRAELEQGLAAARAAHEAARIELELADRRGALLLGLADAPSLERTQAALGEDELLLHYLVGPEGAALFAVRSSEARFVELGTNAVELGERIERILRPIELLRAGRIGLDTLGFDARAARELHELLLGPVRGEVESCRTLWIVPDGPLRRLPFGLLVPAREKRPVDPERLFAQYAGCRFLVEERAIGYLPSAGLLGAESAGPADEKNALLVVADPRPLPPGAPELSGSRAEAEAVAGRRADAMLLLGEAASEKRVKELLPRARRIHLATHGWLDDRRPAFSRLALAPDAGEDGWLFAYEIEPLPMREARVVLSACETLGAAGRGEGLLGLSRAFLQAGARSVVATAWAVDDQASAVLVEEYERALGRGEDAVSALRAAQVALLRGGGREGLLYVHPYFWAAFLHVGQR